jgi:hypothetical protein
MREELRIRTHDVDRRRAAVVVSAQKRTNTGEADGLPPYNRLP